MKENFSQRLYQLRKDANLKQAELANAIKTTQRRISYFESGKIEPDIGTLILLAEFFEVSIDYLVGYKDF